MKIGLQWPRLELMRIGAVGVELNGTDVRNSRNKRS